MGDHTHCEIGHPAPPGKYGGSKCSCLVTECLERKRAMTATLPTVSEEERFRMENEVLDMRLREIMRLNAIIAEIRALETYTIGIDLGWPSEVMKAADVRAVCDKSFLNQTPNNTP